MKSTSSLAESHSRPALAARPRYRSAVGRCRDFPLKAEAAAISAKPFSNKLKEHKSLL